MIIEDFRFLHFAACATLILGATTAAVAQDAAARFRDAAYAEEVSGDLEGALGAYDAVARDPEAPADLRAAALLRAGGCLDLLGRRAEAAPRYAAVLRETALELVALRAEARRRLQALEAVEAPGAASSIEAAIDRLESDDPGERYGAIAALRAADPAEVVPALVRRLEAATGADGPVELRYRAATGPKLRHYAVILLGHLKDPAAIPALRARLEDPIAEIRCNAALSLLKLGDRSGAATLRAELARPGGQARSLAAAHLAHFGDRAAAPALVEDLAGADAYVRASAIQALVRLYGEDLGFAPDASEDARAAALARWRARIALSPAAHDR